MMPYEYGGEVDHGAPVESLLESELETLYRVSQVLSRSLDFRQTLSEVLFALDHDVQNRAPVQIEILAGIALD